MQQTQTGQGKKVGAMSVLMIVAAFALWAIPTIMSAHAGNNDSTMVHACIGNISKVVRIVGVGGTCISSPPLVAETPAHWPQVQGAGAPGPKGDKGDKGEAGPKGVDGTSVTYIGSFVGRDFDCQNGGALFAVGTQIAPVCNGQDAAAAARPDGPCYDNVNRYVDCGNGTVTDTVTGLIWLKQADCLGEADWLTTMRGIASLKTGDCGLTDKSSRGDWRMPTKSEWDATIEHATARGCSPALTNDVGTGCYSFGGSSFTGVAPGLYMSSTSWDEYPPLAWTANLAGGRTELVFKEQPDRVWPVRGGSR